MPDESTPRFARKGETVLCPFCKAPVPRPSALAGSSTARGGRCGCGSIYLLDASGREGGEIVLEGLAHLCGGDLDRAMALRGGIDYRIESVGYNVRGHNAEPIRRGGFGRSKLWFFVLASS
jgi:hypothetical protein